MKKMTWLALAAVLALSLAGLTACGSNSSASSSSAASPSSTSASSAVGSSASEGASTTVKSDEELIKEDFAAQVDAFFAAGVAEAALSADEQMSASLGALGVDAAAFADVFKSAMKLEVTSVAVDGDNATATVEMTIPDFEAGDDVMTAVLEQKLGDRDPNTLSTEEVGALLVDSMKEAFASPDMPTTSSDFPVPYVKTDGKWVMADSEGLKGQLLNMGAQ